MISCATSPISRGRSASTHPSGADAEDPLSNTELRFGEQRPNLAHTDKRLLPQTYQSTTLISRDIPGLTLQVG
ncbi:OprD family outer membrane porin [Azotobacter beijerinckii]|uniref:OprD family outer membrane porin n=1 Tax=Azotobacter beijerinckii TaxID=170623 RepID=UPI0020C9378D|nr:OprD family outer membrane porin [Azotobacter beijerinckii]